MPSPPRLIFMHIPKAGGSTVLDILDRQYPRSTQYAIVSKGNGSNARTTEALRKMPPDAKRHFRIIHGHQMFGLHEAFDDATRYFTILRRPIDRVVSSYHYIRSHPGHFLHDRVADANMTLRQYAEAELNDQVDNYMTRAIAGFPRRTGPCTSETLAAARRNIDEHFLAVGILERFDETLVYLKEALGWETYPAYFRKNVTRGREPGADDPDTLAYIETRNRFDVELYAQAADRFAAEIDRRRAHYDAELERLEEANRRLRRSRHRIQHEADQVARRAYHRVVQLRRLARR